MLELPLPELLTRLIATGVWPSAAGPSMTAQQLKPLIPAERVRRFAPQESLICLQPSPFHTIAAEQAWRSSGDFWEQFCRLDQIVPERALIVGDFGLGSDAPIILDFARDAEKPPVLYLRWGPEHHNEWVQGARDFHEFAELLGLAEGAT